ncbi:hypothetical protein C8R46DRAFT_251241 [Mycena filopes]|nr:hypothetical protein C8R46DRAFT_251241 [Mycena filopes]
MFCIIVLLMFQSTLGTLSENRDVPFSARINKAFLFFATFPTLKMPSEGPCPPDIFPRLNPRPPCDNPSSSLTPMPPARGHATKTLELSAKLCTALNLIGREQMFESIKKELHKRVDLSFDLCLSSSEQPGNMEAYVQTIKKVFPGYFGKDVVQRSTALKAYIASYLDENQAALPPGDVIKVRRFRSRTRRNSQAKPDLVFVLQPVQRPPSAPPMDLDPPEDDTPPPPEFEDGNDDVPDHGASAVPLPSPSPPPTMDPEFASPEPEPEPEPPHPESFLMRFLESCSPSMTSRVDAFQRMGATTQEDLVGMARWHEDHLRPALHRHGIVDSLLQEEALVIGFYSLVNHWPPAAD